MTTLHKIKKILSAKPYTKREEIMHMLTHWIGAILVSLGAGALITLSAFAGGAARIAAVSIFSASMIALYCASTLYHFAEGETAKRRLKVLDHSAIYLLIAGTYTPFLLVNVRGTMGTAMFIIIWLMAILGIVGKFFLIGKVKKLSLIIYLVMGWLAVFAVKDLINTVSLTGLIFLALGGLFYTAGCYFYVRKDKEFYHGIWHIFVLLGTILHFFAVLFGCVLPLNIT